MVNKAVEGHTEATRTPYGSVSGLMFRDAHPIAKKRYAYPMTWSRSPITARGATR